jgi:ABC-2 type transport system ATP-binding protein
MNPVVAFQGVSRWYGSVLGLANVSIVVPDGVTGLLGPNGAGKSTFLRLLTGQLVPSSGRVSVFGKDPVADPSVFRDVGYCSEDDALFVDLTPRETIRFVARFHGFSGREATERTERAIATAGVDAYADRSCEGLSKGQRQRTRLAAALVHEPRLLVLDEPMTGLDPVARRAVLDLMQQWASAGRSVLFSSHILHEVEAASGHVVMIHKGMILAEGSVGHLRSCVSDAAFLLEIAVDRVREFGASLLGRPHVRHVEIVDGGKLRVATDRASDLMLDVVDAATRGGFAVDSITAPDDNLEALFKRLVK